MSEWTCADCGTEGAKPIDDPKFGSFAKFDERYTTGYCDSCSVANPKTPRKSPRRMNRLIRSGVFDRSAFDTNREKARLKELITLFANGKDHIQLMEKQAVDLVELVDKYGAPGFYLPDHLRETVHEILGKKK